MEHISITSNLPKASRLCLGTWVMGGSNWGGAEDKESIATIHRALDLGINIIDTAPVYGFGRSESIVGTALREHGQRDQVLIATKTGLEWQGNGKVFRNTAAAFMRAEFEDSLRRLGTDYIDVYQVHWPDRLVPVEETAGVMEQLLREGKIRAVGVSNYSVEQMEAFRKTCPLHTSQPPYNLFERGVDRDVLPYTNESKIVSLVYGSICRGLLSGRMKLDTEFAGDDLRKVDPKFQAPRYAQYLDAVAELDKFARDRFARTVMQLAVRWVLDRGLTVALLGVRRPDQLDAAQGLFDWSLSRDDMKAIDAILSRCVKDPVGPEFMSSPTRDEPGYQGKYPV